MGRKYFAQKQLVNGSLSANFTTEAIDIQAVDVAGFIFDWNTGVALAGTFQLQVSFDGTKWFTLALGSITLTGATGQHDAEITENRYKYMRGVFTISAGSAIFDCWYSSSAKGN